MEDILQLYGICQRLDDKTMTVEDACTLISTRILILQYDRELTQQLYEALQRHECHNTVIMTQIESLLKDDATPINPSAFYNQILSSFTTTSTPSDTKTESPPPSLPSFDINSDLLTSVISSEEFQNMLQSDEFSTLVDQISKTMQSSSSL